MFLCGQWAYAGPLVKTFVEFDRYTAMSYKTPLLELLVGAAAWMAEAQGLAGAGHVGDKLARMVMYAETVRGLTTAAAVEGHWKEEIFVPHVVLTNAAKYYFTRGYHDVVRDLQDIAGGLVVTGPSEEDRSNPELWRLVEPYLQGRAGVSGEARLQMMNLIRDLAASDLGGYLEVLAIHAEGSLGSPEAHRAHGLRPGAGEGFGRAPQAWRCGMPHVRELFDLSGRVAVITGGSRGLGREMAEGLGEAGAKVVVAARRAEWLEPAQEYLQGRGIEVAAQVCDVSKPEQARSLGAFTVNRFGRLDVLVNNAGVSWGAALEEMPLQRWHQVLQVNLTGTFLVTQAAIPVMRAAGWGRIVNVASVAGLVSLPAEILDAVGYAASKGGVVALTRDLAVKLAPFGITVNAVAPGFFPTRMSEKLLERVQDRVVARVPMGRLGQEGDLRVWWCSWPQKLPATSTDRCGR